MTTSRIARLLQIDTCDYGIGGMMVISDGVDNEVWIEYRSDCGIERTVFTGNTASAIALRDALLKRYPAERWIPVCEEQP